MSASSPRLPVDSMLPQGRNAQIFGGSQALAQSRASERAGDGRSELNCLIVSPVDS